MRQVSGRGEREGSEKTPPVAFPPSGSLTALGPHLAAGYKVYIGPQRYFVTSDVGNGRVQWYAFFALPPGSKKAPSGWGGSTRDEQKDPEENLVGYIKR